MSSADADASAAAAAAVAAAAAPAAEADAISLAPQKSRRARPAASASGDGSGAAGSASADSAAVMTIEVTKHGLLNQWDLWGLCNVPATANNNKKKQVAQNTLVYSFNTVEDFWSIYNSLLKPTAIAHKANVIFLRSEAKPEWEHEFNKQGGEWLAEFDPSCAHRKEVDAAWEQTVLAVIGGTLGDADDIAGVWLQCRPPREVYGNKGGAGSASAGTTYKICIWNRDAEKAQKLGEAWVALMKDKAGISAMPCFYVAHHKAVEHYAEATKTKTFNTDPPVMFSFNRK